MLRLSVTLTATISQPPFFRHLASILVRPLKAVTKLNLLRLTRVIYESHPDVASLAKYGVREAVDRLSRQDDAVLVRELAKEILPTLGSKPAPPTPVRASSGDSTSRYRDPSLRSSLSRPLPIPSSSSRGMPPPPVPDRALSSSYLHSHSQSSQSSSQSSSHSNHPHPSPSQSPSQRHRESNSTPTSNSHSGSARRVNPPPSPSSAASDSHRHLTRDSSNVSTSDSRTNSQNHGQSQGQVPSLLGRTSHDPSEPVKHKRRISRQLR